MRAAAASVTGMLRRLAVNPAFRYTALNQLMRLMLGPLVLIVLPVFLSAEELGFWYTMTGVTAIMAFADMGLSTAVMQFSAHEHARRDTHDGEPGMASETGGSRQDALLLFAVRRIACICAIGLPVVFLVGVRIMGSDDAARSWIAPWTCLCITSALSLLLSVVLAFKEGQDAVGPMQRLRAGMAFLMFALTVAGPPLGLGLWTLPLATAAATLFGFTSIMRHHFPGIDRLRAISSAEIRSWSATISPVLNRYSLSWVGGYLMFQLFAPITFYIAGPALAGRVGLTVSIFTSIFSLSNVWSSFRLPLLSIAVARQDAGMLRRVFFSGSAASVATYVFLSTVTLIAYSLFGGIREVSEKLLDPLSILLLAVGWGFQVIVHNAALFLRAFKVDPLVWVTWLAAIHTVAGTAAILTLGWPSMMFAAFVTSYLWLLPAVFVLCSRRMQNIADWASAA